MKNLFFIANNAYTKILSILTDYDLSPDVIYNHYYRNYISISYNSRSNMQSMLNSKTLINNTTKASIGLLILCIAMGTYLLVFEWWFIWVTDCTPDA